MITTQLLICPTFAPYSPISVQANDELDMSAESSSSIQSQRGQQSESSPTEHRPEAVQCRSSAPILNTIHVPGHKLVIDNIDSTAKPRQQRIDAQMKSLHYVHGGVFRPSVCKSRRDLYLVI